LVVTEQAAGSGGAVLRRHVCDILGEFNESGKINACPRAHQATHLAKITGVYCHTRVIVARQGFAMRI
jgi:hypothetical protein